MKLVIVESPAKAKTIEKYLGKEYKVKASIGHIRDLPKSNKDAVDIKNGYKPKYIISADKKKIVSDLKKEAEKADEILLASDPDREGEAIAWHLEEVLKEDKKIKAPIKRITFNEITERAVTEALNHKRQIDTNLRKAQEARRVLDRLVGYDLSGLIWQKVRYGLSAGRVQSPALRILMEREREIRAFVPTEYFNLQAILNDGLVFDCQEVPDSFARADEIKNLGEKNTDWQIKDLIKSKAVKNPKIPFTTSTLQQSASNLFGFAPSRTMRAAQKLYEKGAITYMRTDSPNLSIDAESAIHEFIKKEFGAGFLEKRTFKAKSKNAQEAHEAIRPTNFNVKNFGDTQDETRLYDLIRTRTIASQMKSAEILRTKIVTAPKAEILNYPLFSLNGQIIIDPGFLKFDHYSKSEEKELPKLEVGDLIKLNEIEIIKKETTPPDRYTEAGLIKELEKRGIGRPSTYASILKTIEDRGYVEKKGRTLFPTDTGDVVSSFLETYFMEYIGDKFTAEMENTLDDIADGIIDYNDTLKAIYEPFHLAIIDKKEVPKLTTLGIADEKYRCPICGSGMDIKLGKTGKFLSCNRFPDCTGALTLDGKNIEDQISIGKLPSTGEEVYLLEGRFGPYLQIGKNNPDDKKLKPKRASLPAGLKADDVTLEIAEKILSLPRVLGIDSSTNQEIIANIGRFGPYVGRGRDFRSLKKGEDPYTITLSQALEILNKPKSLPKGTELVRKIGTHPKTGKEINLLKSKNGFYLPKGLRRIPVDNENITLEEALNILK